MLFLAEINYRKLIGVLKYFVGAKLLTFEFSMSRAGEHKRRVIQQVQGRRVIQEVQGRRVIQEVQGRRVIQDVQGRRVIQEVQGRRVIQEVHG